MRRAGEAVDRLAEMEGLDAEGIVEAVRSALPPGPLKDLLHGTPIGHPLHPILTDVAIGFLLSGSFLDLFGGRRSEDAADLLTAAGAVSAVPTAISGLADWLELGPGDRRVGIVHAGANSVALVLYLASLGARWTGARGAGRALSLAGLAAVTVGGYIGGHLAYRRGTGVNRHAFERPDDGWTDAISLDDLPEGEPVTAEVDGETVMLYRTNGAFHALSNRCAHLEGPLAEGEINETELTVTCPWHGSTFRLEDGEAVAGPATAPQPCYDVRVSEGRVQVRRR